MGTIMKRKTLTRHTVPLTEYKKVVATLGSAIAEWSYLFPEQFDDDQHQVQSEKNLRTATRIYTRALNTLDRERTS